MNANELTAMCQASAAAAADDDDDDDDDGRGWMSSVVYISLRL